MNMLLLALMVVLPLGLLGTGLLYYLVRAIVDGLYYKSQAGNFEACLPSDLQEAINQHK